MTSYVPMFYGTDGTLIVQHDSILLATRSDEDGSPLDIPAPNPENESSAALFIHHIRTGEPIVGICGPAVGLATQQVLEAALTSAAEGRTIALPLFNIGAL